MGEIVVPEMSPGAWALLGMLHRAKHGGPPAPNGFILEYGELQANALIVRVGSKLMITEKGESALRERFLDD